MRAPDIPDHAELIRRARGVAEQIAGYELESERDRSLHPASLASMREAELLKAMQPQRIGGFECSLPTIHAIARELGRGCTSSAWVYMVTAAHTFVLGMFPEAVQDEIAADDPDTFIPGTLASQGKAQPVEGGFRVSGQWQFASGCDHARWGLFCAVQTDSTREEPKHVHVMVPKSDYRIEDTWHVMGLDGTGSKDVVMDDVFIPAQRALPTGDLFAGNTEAASRHETYVYRMPVLPALTYCLTAPALSLAERIYNAHVERTAGRRDRYDGSSKARKPATQLRVAESWAEIQCAAAMADQIGADFGRHIETRQQPDDALRVEIKWRATYAVRLCVRAANRLFEASGANTVYDREPIQRLVQGLQVMSHHAAVDFDNNGTSFGSQALGLGPGTFLI